METRVKNKNTFKAQNGTGRVVIELTSNNLMSILMKLIHKNISFQVHYDPKGTKEVAHYNKQPIVTNDTFVPKKSDLEIFATNVDNYIDKCLKKGLPFEIEKIAQDNNISISTLKKKSIAVFGTTCYQYFTKRRMDHATKLLINGHTSVYISEYLGYSHPIKFNKMFQKTFGITPKKYQIKNGIYSKRLST